jgi:large subunit ribosomal protein L24
MKLHIKKGDKVVVLSGNHKGEAGEVREVNTTKSRAIVTGVNLISKHSKASSKFPQGGIIKQEGSIHISNLMVVDPKTGKPAKTGRKVVEGKLERYFKSKEVEGAKK